MSNTADQHTRSEVIRDLTVEVHPTGRIVDYIDRSKTRPDTPEERVRQYYSKILCEDYGYSKDCMALEVPINIGSDTKSADIVIFQSPEATAGRIQGQIELIVETKKPNSTEGKNQLASYIFSSSASGGVWFNGQDIAYFRRIESPTSHLADWTNIPRHGQSWDAVGHYKKEDLEPPRDLKQIFKRCHNIIYRSGSDSEDIALDMVRVILAKYRDEQNDGEFCEFRCTPEEYKTAKGRKSAAKRVHDLFSDVVSDFPDVFASYEKITIGDQNLATVINELQPFRFLADDETEQVYDIIGTAFEVYVAAHLKGARGQYFTNRLFVNMMVQILDPNEKDIIYDPACGSAGFLIAALRHVRNRIFSSSRTAAAKAREIRSASERLFGTDISPKLVKVAKTNMILNGDGHGGIAHANALQHPHSALPPDFPLRSDSSKKQTPTIILTNPPFGASHELRERNRTILEQFDLGHAWEQAEGSSWLQKTSALSEGVPPEILFLERCIERLAPGGRLAIVLARGVLDNREALAARQYLLKNTRLLAVVNCHPNTFAPFNGTKAAILFLEKKHSPGISSGEDYPVFMAISQRVGQDSMGREIYKTNSSGDLLLRHGQPVLDHDMDQIAESWREFNSGRPIGYEAAWALPVSRIIDSPEMRMNPTRYAPIAERAIAEVLDLADSEEWDVERLGDFATIFNGPRFRRPFADEGVISGSSIVRMFTPKAFFEERGESSKYLDRAKANPTQLRQLEELTLQKDWILIVDSGTAGKLLGRVGMTAAMHEGTIGNNNMIRVVIEDPVKRAYVYQFLRSEIGQALLLRNVYGTNQDHIEPDDVKDIHIPMPKDVSHLTKIMETVQEVGRLREAANELDHRAQAELSEIFGKVKEQASIDEVLIEVDSNRPR